MGDDGARGVGGRERSLVKRGGDRAVRQWRRGGEEDGVRATRQAGSSPDG